MKFLFKLIAATFSGVAIFALVAFLFGSMVVSCNAGISRGMEMYGPSD